MLLGFRARRRGGHGGFELDKLRVESRKTFGVQIVLQIVVELADRVPEMRHREFRLSRGQQLVTDDQMPFHHRKLKQEVRIRRIAFRGRRLARDRRPEPRRERRG